MRLVVIDEKWQTPMVETDKEYAEGKLGRSPNLSSAESVDLASKELQKNIL